MTDVAGHGNTSGEPSPPSSSPSRSPAEAAIVIAAMAAIVALAFHHDVTGTEAIAALAALLIPESSPVGAVRRLLGR